jgi:hypothetical protein
LDFTEKTHGRIQQQKRTGFRKKVGFQQTNGETHQQEESAT